MKKAGLQTIPSDEQTNSAPLSFGQYCISRDNRFEWVTTTVACVAGFFLLRYLYPFPNVYADTGAYISVAGTGLIGNYRPIGYSWLMAVAHAVWSPPAFLVLLQTILYFFSSLFLFLTAKYFFGRGNNITWKAFYLIFLLAPVCIYLCNFVISDSLFISLTNLWLATLFFMLFRKSAYALCWNAVFLFLLMMTRYIALFYPMITVITLFLAFFRRNKIQFVVYSGIQVLLFFAVYIITRHQTNKNIGVDVFSAFSGWQTASNALHLVPYIELDPSEIKDPEVQSFHRYILANYGGPVFRNPDTVHVYYLWSPEGALKKYMNALQKAGDPKRPYLYYWHSSSIAMGKWGNYIIRRYPVKYLRHFMKPNAEQLFRLPNEALYDWPGPSRQMKDWFGCAQCPVAPRSNSFHQLLSATASKSFNVLWIFFGISLVALCFPKWFGLHGAQYGMLWILAIFALTYTLMSVYASPIVYRYMLAIRHSLVLLPFLLLHNKLSFTGKHREV
jgi:hypothetical protein